MVGEKSSIQFGYGYQGLDVRNVGSVTQIQNFVTMYGKYFNEIRLNAGWNRNSYNQMPYPTKGTNQQASVLVALPGQHDSLSYYKTAYQARLYQPVVKGFIFTALGNVAFGNMFNNQGLPFFENYFAGGIAQPGQVRGYDSYSLGPQDNHGRALGANLLVNASAGVVLPYPLSRESFRTTVFSDMGNVFSYGTPDNIRGTPSGPLRFSAGLGVEWRSPFGPLAFSLAKALNLQPLDQEQWFQFSVTSGF